MSFFLRLWFPLLCLCCVSAYCPAADQVTSKYSSTKTGVVLEQSTAKDEIDFFKWRCKGFGGYNIKYGKTEVDLMRPTFDLSPGTFPNKANDVVEWRGVQHDDQFIPYALIYRLEGGNDETRKIKTRLIVIKLDAANPKVVGFPEGKTEDADAKRIADRYRPR